MDMQKDVLTKVDSFLEMLPPEMSPEDVSSSLSGILQMAGSISEVSANLVNTNDPNNTETMLLKAVSGSSEEQVIFVILYFVILYCHVRFY